MRTDLAPDHLAPVVVAQEIRVPRHSDDGDPGYAVPGALANSFDCSSSIPLRSMLGCHRTPSGLNTMVTLGASFSAAFVHTLYSRNLQNVLLVFNVS